VTFAVLLTPEKKRNPEHKKSLDACVFFDEAIRWPKLARNGNVEGFYGIYPYIMP